MVLERDVLIEECRRFARDSLGPASEAILLDPSVQALTLSRLRAGRDLPDAVLGEVHRAAQTDIRLADEFLGFFLTHAKKRGKPLVSPALRRLIDTDDLVQSVLRDAWGDFVRLEFETRSQFISLLAQRLRWKAADKSKHMNALRRSEHRRVDEDPSELQLQASNDRPDVLLGLREEAGLVMAALLRLPERDQRLLRLHLRGEPISMIASESGLEPETARKALQRAVRKLRSMLGSDKHSR